MKGKETLKRKVWIAVAALVAIALVLVLTLSKCSGTASTAGETANGATAETAETKDAIAQWLESEGTDTMELKEDITLSSLCFINGDKTITGTGTIRMESGGEYIIVLNSGASLTLDGPTLDGTNNAQNGIYVSEGASLNLISGNLVNLTGHGVRVLGKAEMSGGSIGACGTNWFIVDTGAEVNISGGSFTSAGEEGILSAEGSSVTLGENVSMDGAAGSLLYNYGTMTVNGGTYRNAESYAFHNEGTMQVSNVEFSGAELLGYLENTATGDVTLTGGSMTDSASDFIFNQGKAKISGVCFDTCAGTAIETRGLESSLDIGDCSFENVGKAALLNKSTTVTAANLTIGSCGSYGIYNRASDFTGSNVTIASAGESAVYNDFAQDGDTDGCGDLTLDGFTIGTADSYGIRTNGGVLTLKNGKVGQTGSYSLYVKEGEASTDGVDFEGVIDRAKCVVQIGLSSAPAGVVTMDNTTITGGARGISNHGTLTFNSGKIYGNKSNGDTKIGAGISNTGTLTVNGGTITDNHAASSGGGIHNSGRCVINSGANITFNSSAASGGGIATNTDELTINGGVFCGNYALNYGGAIFVNEKGGVSLRSASITRNRSGKGGGGIAVSGAGRLYGAAVLNNTTEGLGGGVYVGTQGTAVITALDISGNSSGDEKSGGGVYNLGNTKIMGGNITDNKSGSYGGGVSNSSATDGTSHGTMVISGGTISGNSSVKGGGGVYNTGAMTISGGKIADNETGTRGEGVYSSGTLSLTGGTINGNKTGNEASPYDLYIYKGTTTISGSPDLCSIYVAKNGTLEVGGKISANSMNLYLSNYDVGDTALTGSTALISANKAKFVLPNEVIAAGKYIGDDGTITKDGQDTTEAAYYSGSDISGDPVATGFFAQMCAKAKEKGGTVKVLKNLTELDGFEMGSYTIDGNGNTLTLNSRITIGEGASAVIQNVTLASSKTLDKALVYNYIGTKLTLKNVTIQNTTSEASSGGAVYNNTILIMDGVTIQNNTSTTASGAGLFLTSSATATLKNCTITGNTCGDGKNGNDIYTGSSNLTLSGSTKVGELYLAKEQTFTAASGWTGTIGVSVGSKYFVSGTPIVTGTLKEDTIKQITLKNNDGISEDNIVILLGTDGKLMNKPVAEIQAYYFTGSSTTGTPNAKGSFADMLAMAQASGGTVKLQADEVPANGFTMGSYTIDGNGKILNLNGSITIASGATAVIQNVTLVSSNTLDKALVYNYSGTKLTLTKVAINGTTSSASYGGAVYNNTTLVMDGVTITGNTSTASGAGLFLTSSATATLKNCTITENTCGDGKNGNDIYAGSSNLTLSGSTKVGELYLAKEQTFTAASSGWSGSVGVKVAKSAFTANTKIVTGTVTNTVIGQINLLNNGTSSTTSMELVIEGSYGVLRKVVQAYYFAPDNTSTEPTAQGDFTDMLARAQTGGGTIQLQVDVTADDFEMGGFTIDGNGKTLTLKDQISTTQNTTSSMENITLKASDTGYRAINNAGTLTLTGVTISGFTDCKNSGGAIQNTSTGTLILASCSISGNTSQKNGNDIFVNKNNAVTISGKTTVGELYLADGMTFAVSGTLTGTVTIRVSESNFKAGTQLVTGDVTANLDKLVLYENDPETSNIYLADTGYLRAVKETYYFTGSDTTGTPDDKGTFADMLAKATAGGTIQLQDNVTSGAIFMTGFTIDGKGYTLTLNGGITSTSGSNELKNLTLSQGTQLSTAAVTNKATLTVTSCIISEFSNSATTSVGAAFTNNSGSTLNLNGCTITGNTSTGKYGGAIYNNGTLTVSGGSITNNTAKNASGGGIFNSSNSTCTITGSEITSNTCGTNKCYGNDIYAGSSNLTLSGSAEVDELYLASGKTFTIDSGWSGSVGVKVGSSAFVAGTQITSNTELSADTIAKITLANGNSLCLGTDGTLAEKATEPQDPDPVDPETYEAYYFSGSDTTGTPDDKGDFADMLAKAQASGGTIQLQSNVSSGAFSMTGFTIDGKGTYTLTLSDQIETTSGTTSAMKNITLAASGTGYRAINNAGTLTLTGVKINGFKDCKNSGGAIQVTKTGALTLIGCSISGNTSKSNGQDIFANNKAVTISGNTTIGELYLASSVTFKVSNLGDTASIGIRVGSKAFAANTTIVASGLTSADISKINLLNNGTTTLYLHTDGILYAEAEETKSENTPS